MFIAEVCASPKSRASRLSRYKNGLETYYIDGKSSYIIWPVIGQGF